MTVYFTADLHFFHNKDFIYAARGFNSVEDMNEQIIKNINDTVGEDDTLYILGDVVMGDKSNCCIMNGINCNDIRLIRGNHDTNAKVDIYDCFRKITSISFAEEFVYKKIHFFLSHYYTMTSNYDDSPNIRGRVWNLHGHTHSTDKFEYNGAYNVGIDANDCKPVSIDEIVERIRNWYNS